MFSALYDCIEKLKRARVDENVVVLIQTLKVLERDLEKREGVQLENRTEKREATGGVRVRFALCDLDC